MQWGPQKQAAKSVELVTRRTYSAIAPNPPLIHDTNLSERENAYLKHLNIKHRSDDGFVSIILQHLWFTYGLVFPDPVLLNSAMVYGSWQPSPIAKHQEQLVDHYSFISRFHHSLMNAISQNQIREEHFFALFLVLYCTSNDVKSRQTFKTTYRRLLLKILTHLNEHSAQSQLSLRYLYNYILFLLRRDDLSFWIANRLDEDFHLYDASYELYAAGKAVPIPVSKNDSRLLFGSSTWLSSVARIQARAWDGVIFRCMDDIQSLWAAFLLHISRSPVNEPSAQIIEILGSVELNLSAIENHPTIAFFLHDVSEINDWN